MMANRTDKSTAMIASAANGFRSMANVNDVCSGVKFMIERAFNAA